MRSMPPTFPKPDRARSRAGCRPRPTPIFRRSPIRPAWSTRSRPVELSMLHQPRAQRRRMEHHDPAEGQDEYRAHRRSEGSAFPFYAGGSFDALTGRKPHGLRGDPGDVTGFSETMRINLNGGWLWDRSVDRHYLALRHRLRLEVHRYLAVDHRGLRAGRRNRIRQAWSSRGFRPACATGRTRFSRSI